MASNKIGDILLDEIIRHGLVHSDSKSADVLVWAENTAERLAQCVKEYYPVVAVSKEVHSDTLRRLARMLDIPPGEHREATVALVIRELDRISGELGRDAE